MRGEWCYFESHFSKQECEDIIAKAKNLPTEKGRTGNASAGEFTDIRRSKVSWIHSSTPELAHYFDRVDKLARWGNKDWFNFHLTNLPSLQFTEYDSAYGGKYGKHVDVFWISKNPTHRKLSIVINLSDPQDYTGADFMMYGVNSRPPDVIKKQGSVLLFPSFIEHEVTPITSGIRYSLVGWYEGPQWV